MSNLFVPIKTADLRWNQGMPCSIKYEELSRSFASSMNQSRDVFVDGNNLIERWQALSPNEINRFTIAETGFGFGLNFLLSWQLWEQYAPENGHLHFISCEKHPFSRADLIKSLSFLPELQPQAQQLIDNYPILTPGYHHLSFGAGRVILTLMLGDAFDCYEQLLVCGEPQLECKLRTFCVDAWFLDGFSPEKNERMWSDPLIRVVAMLSKEGTTLATNTTVTEVKERLSQYGFGTEPIRAATDRERKIAPTAQISLIYTERSPYLGFSTPCRSRLGLAPASAALATGGRRYTPWHVGAPEIYHKKSAIIIGAGLAGCFTAYSLAKRGWKITLIDELDDVGKGGSANQQAVLFPKLSAYNSPLTQFMLSAFLYANQVYQEILKQAPLGELKGSLLLAYNQKENLAQAGLHNWLAHYPELGALVDAQKASELTGLPLYQSGLFIPLSGWINSPALCAFLAKTEGITVLKNTPVKELFFDEQWIVNDLKTDVLILANGPNINAFKESAHLEVKSIRGQMSAVSATPESAALTIPLCGEGHVLPVLDGLHRFGATYELKTADTQIKTEDDAINLAKLALLASDNFWSEQVMGHWAGTRAATSDYLPLVGQIANESEFMRQFAGLESNSKRWIAQAGAYYPGLYACAGFGSRGLTTIPLCAEWLACVINNEINFLPRNLQQALSPARFLRKNIIRGHVKID